MKKTHSRIYCLLSLNAAMQSHYIKIQNFRVKTKSNFFFLDIQIRKSQKNLFKKRKLKNKEFSLKYLS